MNIDVSKITPDVLYNMINEIGGMVFTEPYLLNIAAIRNFEDPDDWNDTLFYFYHDENGACHFTRVNEFTTDPGVKYLKEPMNSHGTSIIVEGWYRRLWKYGKHKGYNALQQYSPIKVYRDWNRDGKFDPDPTTIEEGVFGINLHRANRYSVASKVGPHSAGCCVIRRYNDWTKFIRTVELCYKTGGQRYWSLALFNKN